MCFYIVYSHQSVPEQGKISQQGLKLLTRQKADRIIALYRSAVISCCVIRNSAEFPYLVEEERRPWGKLGLWQEFIISIAPIYIDFVTSAQTDTHTRACLEAHLSLQNHNRYQVDTYDFSQSPRKCTVMGLINWWLKVTRCHSIYWEIVVILVWNSCFAFITMF